MADAQKIHIFGASGSGTTTLGAALAVEFGIRHLDTDDYYWKKTEPPLVAKMSQKCRKNVAKNSPADRVEMIRADIGNRTEWVLCGSLCSWGDPLLDEFTLAVFLYLDPTVRMRRLKQREQERYGARIEPGGDMHQQHCDFMTWAASYDSAKAPTRSFDLHNAWMQQLACPILKLDSSASTPALLSATIIKQQSQIGSKD